MQSPRWDRMTAMQQDPRYLPASNQVGVLAAIILLTYALTHIASGPGLTLALQFPGFYFAYSLTLGTAMTLMAGGLTASGMDWLLQAHPGLQRRRTLEHWMLPTLTALIIGIVLDILPSGRPWWIGLTAGAVILVAVLVAEYITVDPSAPLYALASAGLTALSMALFLLFVVSLRLGSARLFLVIPATLFAAGLVALRTLHLRIGEHWDFPWALAIGFVCAQLGAGLHYWPISALQFGLSVLAPLYGLTVLANELAQDVPLANAAREPSIIMGALWIAAAFVR
jgi:hypothetical protein